MPSAKPSAAAHYRPDIDGLRAVAVVLVLLHHVGVWAVTGGYVGVDVFFVISGYLIGALILRELEAGRFSFARFYERRFRRIIPAMIVMLSVTTFTAWWFFSPLELRSYAASALGAVYSVSNIVLLHQTGYFDLGAKLVPTLHTWSLGVEEQFYFVFPLLLLVLMRWARQALRRILWVLTVALYALAFVWTARHPNEAYYLAPYRAGEFLLGILLAARALPLPKGAGQRNSGVLAGLFLILWGAFHFTIYSPFPGWRVILPTVGALLVIWAGEAGDSAMGRVLGSPPLRWIGLISYSLYLWHWPLQVFQTTNEILVPDRYPSRDGKLAVIAASFVLATLSWRFIEQPFRTGWLRGRAPLFIINGVLLVTVSVFCLCLIYNEGALPSWAPESPATRAFGHAMQGADVRWGQCYLGPENFATAFDRKDCLADDPARPQILVLGDSHAAQFTQGMRKMFPDRNITEATAPGCPPLLPDLTPDGNRCRPYAEEIFQHYLAQHPVNLVVLLARWSDNEVAGLQETIAWLRAHGSQVMVVGPSIEFNGSLTRLLKMAEDQHDPALTARHRDLAPEALDRRMKALAATQWHVPYVSVYDDLCRPPVEGPGNVDGCILYGAPGIPLLYDSDHLTPAGAALLARKMRERNQLPEAPRPAGF
jgi:peptidoglycan/LPS O-acetylase OafA/YrhL